MINKNLLLLAAMVAIPCLPAMDLDAVLAARAQELQNDSQLEARATRIAHHLLVEDILVVGPDVQDSLADLEQESEEHFDETVAGAATELSQEKRAVLMAGVKTHASVLRAAVKRLVWADATRRGLETVSVGQYLRTRQDADVRARCIAHVIQWSNNHTCSFNYHFSGGKQPDQARLFLDVSVEGEYAQRILHAQCGQPVPTMPVNYHAHIAAVKVRLAQLEHPPYKRQRTE